MLRQKLSGFLKLGVVRILHLRFDKQDVKKDIKRLLRKFS